MTARHTRTQTRTEQAITWVAWHFAELAAVTAPLVLSWLVSGWLAFGSLLAGAGWAVHEITVQRRTRDRLAAGGPTPRQITSTTNDNSTAPAETGGRDETREGA
jgi:hypothetical protein